MLTRRIQLLRPEAPAQSIPSLFGALSEKAERICESHPSSLQRTCGVTKLRPSSGISRRLHSCTLISP